MLKTVIAAIFLSLAAVAALQPAYFYALVALDTVAPREARRAHLAQAFETGVLSADQMPTRWFHGGGEQFTECGSHGVGLNLQQTSAEAAILADRPFLPGNVDKPCAALWNAVTGNGPVTWQHYVRYWHGYRLYQATMVALMPLWAVRVLNAVLLAGAIGFFALQVRHACGATVAFVLLVPALVLTDLWRVWRISPHFIGIAWIFLGAGLFALCRRKQVAPLGLTVLAAVLGSVFNFIDLLVNPPWQPMLLGFLMLMPAVLATPRQGARHYSREIFFAALVVLAWFGGYGATWLSKWAATAIMLSDAQAVRQEVLSEMFWWTAADHPYAIHAPVIATVRVMLRPFERFGGTIIVAGLALWIYRRSRLTPRPIDWTAFWVVCLPIGVLVIWAEVLRNHTQFHLSVSSRTAAASIGILLSAWIAALRDRPEISNLAPDLAAMIRQKLRNRR